MENTLEKIENDIDQWLPNKLDKSIPRYKYIYHCQCAFLDMMIDKKLFFSSAESLETQCIFALNYNIHLAYRYLKEDEAFEYTFDRYLYLYATKMIWEGLIYAELCDIFPKLHSGNASMVQNGKHISFVYKDIPREKNRLMDYFLFRKPLSYLLQYACGISKKMKDFDRQLFLSDLYNNYWGENLWNNDYEPYTAIEGGGIRDYISFAAMKRFMLLYDNDFDIKRLRLSQVLILFSKNGTEGIRSFIPSNNDDYYKMAFEDCVYKPLGKGDFPKANIADAPIIRTNSGCSFINPLVFLFNNSLDTQFLNYLRRHDKSRFLIIKDKIKERCIPQIQNLLHSKISGLKDVTNFEVRIPGKGKQKRELDYLVADSGGVGLYIEFKHFYIPESAGEVNVLDEEFKKAMKKMPEQLDAIKKSWDSLSQEYKLPTELNELHGMIVSYMYTGCDVPFNDDYPLVNMSILSNAIVHCGSLHSIYKYCCNVESVYKNIPIVIQNRTVQYAGYEFDVQDVAINPEFETKINRMLKEQIHHRFINNGMLYYVPYMAIDYNDILDMQSQTYKSSIEI